jgi:hypothetical protein
MFAFRASVSSQAGRCLLICGRPSQWLRSPSTLRADTLNRRDLVGPSARSLMVEGTALAKPPPHANGLPRGYHLGATAAHPRAQAKHAVSRPAWAVSQRSASSSTGRFTQRRRRTSRRTSPNPRPLWVTRGTMHPATATICGFVVTGFADNGVGFPAPVVRRGADQSSGLPTGGRMDRCSRSMTKMSAPLERRSVDQILTNCWFFKDSPSP